MKLCDVHILHLNEPPAWLMQCQNSLYGTMADVHVIDGVENEIGLSRKQGFDIGNSPFIACADSDDVYVGSTINLLLQHMLANPKLGIAYSGEFRWKPETGEKEHLYKAFNARMLCKTPMLVHGFTLFRRAAAEPFLHYLPAFKNKFECWFLSVAIVRAGWGVFSTPIIGRWWRQHSFQTSRKKNLNDKKIMMDFIRYNKFPEV